jgi:NADH-quinone oxidoreductase subunit L
MDPHSAGPDAHAAHDAGHGHGSDAGHGHAPGGHAPAGPDRTPLMVAVGWAVLLAGASFIFRRVPDASPDNYLPFVILLMPLLTFTVLAIFGDAIRDQGESRGAMVMACLSVLTSFGAAVWVVLRLFAGGGPRTALHVSQPALPFESPWIQAGSLYIPFNLLIDNLSAVMMLVVTGVGSLIHIYSYGYMSHDPERVRYFSYLNLFTFFMLVLVMGGNLPLMFVGWEGVGLCSYLLIGFWFQKQSASDAGKKAFIVNRIGDAGLILGMILLFHSQGSLDLFEIATNASALAPETGVGTVTVICLLLFVGACGKSAQIPLHVWLPDAMEGPTPVSALIHAATMVTAGVYMVARLAPLYLLSPTAMGVVAVIGTATAVLGATIALVQTDIKKVLAYSTVSQLGYMFLACGVGAFGVGVFHLFTHAFFKALLFLGSGSVIHAMGGEQDMRKMGGLRKKIPWTFWTFLVGTLAIAGIPGLAGFASKDAILAAAFEQHRMALFALGMITALLTAFYMGRLLFMTFFGTFRGDAETEAHIHESPPSMIVPLLILSVGSIVAGWGAWVKGLAWLDIPKLVEPVFRRHAEAHAPHPGWLPVVATLVALAGLWAAYYLFLLATDVAARMARSLQGPARILEARYHFDDVYNWFASRVVVGGSEKVLWRGVDASLIDGLVNGSAAVVGAIAQGARFVQTGLVRAYALLILGGSVVLLGYLLWR